MNTISNSVVFITGAFISNNCWDEWILYFEKEGYYCIAPAWPHKEAPAEELRNRPVNDPIALNTIASLTHHFAGIINTLPEKPVLIGHSLGGLVVQLLLQRGLGIAGVAIHSFPPKGANRFRPSFLRAIWQTLMLFTSDRETYLISFRKWKYTIANRMACEQQKEFYYKYVTPESKKVIRDLFKCSTNIDFEKLRAPLLLTSGSNDKLIPASINYINYRKYANNNSITDYKEFQGHTHLVFDYSSWIKEADFILYWLKAIHKKQFC
jgi:pimeloyl-ACP methyl ester carboxylesterase